MASQEQVKSIKEMSDEELRAHIADLDKQIVEFPDSLPRRLAEEDTGATTDDESGDRERGQQAVGDASYEDEQLHQQRNEAQAELDRRTQEAA